MGSTQLLLLVLTIILVGIGVTLGVQAANDATVSTNRYNVINDLKTFGTKAMLYAKANGKTFDGFTMSYLGKTNGSNEIENANGKYAIGATFQSDRVMLTGNGAELGNDGTTKVAYTLMVYPDSLATNVLQEN